MVPWGYGGGCCGPSYCGCGYGSGIGIIWIIIVIFILFAIFRNNGCVGQRFF